MFASNDRVYCRVPKQSKVTIHQSIEIFEYAAKEPLFNSVLSKRISTINGLNSEENNNHYTSNLITRNITRCFGYLFDCLGFRSKSHKIRRESELGTKPVTTWEKNNGYVSQQRVETQYHSKIFKPDYNQKNLRTQKCDMVSTQYHNKILNPDSRHKNFRTQKCNLISSKPIAFNKNGLVNKLFEPETKIHGIKSPKPIINKYGRVDKLIEPETKKHDMISPKPITFNNNGRVDNLIEPETKKTIKFNKNGRVDKLIEPETKKHGMASPKPIVFNKNGQINKLIELETKEERPEVVSSHFKNCGIPEIDQAISTLASKRIRTSTDKLDVNDLKNNENFFKCLRTLVHQIDQKDDAKELIWVLRHIVNSTDPQVRYKTCVEIGAGSSGSVYKANDLYESRIVAIKKMDLVKQTRKGLLLNEAIIMRDFKHTNIVETYGSYLVNKELWVVMEYLESDLTKFLGFMSEQQISYVTKCVLKALDFLHSNGLIHRDVKSQQILLSKYGRVKLADYGYVAQSSDLLECKSMCGTSGWMAPEMLEIPRNGYDSKVDIWSLGITIKEMLAWNLYTGKFSSQIDKFINRMLVSNSQKRASAAELLEDPFIKQASSENCLLPLIAKFRSN